MPINNISRNTFVNADEGTYRGLQYDILEGISNNYRGLPCQRIAKKLWVYLGAGCAIIGVAVAYLIPKISNFIVTINGG